MPADERPGLGHDLVVRVLAALGAGQPVRLPSRVAGQGMLAVVVPEVGRIVGMGVDLVVVAEELVETLAVSDARAAGVAQPPLAETAGGVARPFEYLGHGGIGVAQRDTPGVAPHRCVPHMLPGHQHRTAGGTDVAARVDLHKPHPLGRQAVDTRCADLRLPVTAQVTVAQVIGHDEDDVRPRLARRSGRDGGGHGQAQNTAQTRLCDPLQTPAACCARDRGLRHS